MDFLAIRNHFRTLSGRYDLVDDDTTEVVEFLINEASRNLDRLTEHQKSFGVFFSSLAIGAFHVSIPYCRAIQEVWVTKTGNEKWQVLKMDLQDLISEYLSAPPDNGAPIYYSPVVTRKIPEDADLSSFSSFLTYTDTLTNVTSDFNGIVVSCPTDEQLLVEVKGLFYSKYMSEDDDQNYWSVVHPLTLLKATMRELEIFNQNQSKVKAWDEELAIEITNINKDMVEEEIAEVTEIGD